jgi:hypothetical protein
MRIPNPVTSVRRLRDHIWQQKLETAELKAQVVRLTTQLERLADTTQENFSVLSRVEHSAGYASRSLLTTHGKPRVLFLVHNYATWYAYDELYRLLEEANDFEVLAASIPKRFPGATTFSGEDDLHTALVKIGIPHLRLPYMDSEIGLDLLRSWEPDFIFRQSQWDADIPDAYSVSKLSFARLCFLPYHMLPYAKIPSTESEHGDGVWDSDLQRAAWLTFCTCQAVKDGAIRRDVPLAEQRMIVTGHPKVRHILMAPPSWPLPLPKTDENVTRILWDAHHTVGKGWFQFGMFPRIAKDMLQWAREDRKTQFVFIPHPGLITMMENGHSGLSPDQLHTFKQDWAALPNTETSIESDYAKLFAASDALISDGISLLAEYQITGKPVVFLERPDHIEWNEIGSQTIQGAHAVADVQQAHEYLTQVLKTGANPLAKQEQRTRTIFFSEENAAQNMLQALKDSLKNEFKTPVVPSGVPRQLDR